MPTKIDGLVVLGASLFYKEKKVTRLNGMQMIFSHHKRGTYHEDY